MSADNWAVCPRCYSEAEELVGRENCWTFHEDCEFYGAGEGEIKVDYTGRCTECGLMVELSAIKRFWP